MLRLLLFTALVLLQRRKRIVPTKIIEEMPPNMKAGVLTFLYERFLMNIPIFRGLSSVNCERLRLRNIAVAPNAVLPEPFTPPDSNTTGRVHADRRRS